MDRSAQRDPAIITGFSAETRIARRTGWPVGTLRDAGRLLDAGAGWLISFGIAGGLASGLPAGTLISATEVIDEDGHRWPAMPLLSCDAVRAPVAASSTIVATAAAKLALHQRTGAVAVDMESAEVARLCAGAGVKTVVIRAIADPAERDLPPAALVGLKPDGRVDLRSVLASVLRQPAQIPALIEVARDTRRALRTLRRVF